MISGAPCRDAPIRDARGANGWVLEHLGGAFVAISFGPLRALPDGVRGLVVDVDIEDTRKLVAAATAALPASSLIRPDEHVAARFRSPTPLDLARALAQANAQGAA